MKGAILFMNLKLRLVTLPAMRVAAARGFGASPESIAWEKILNWANENGISAERGKTRFFGFNNPNPSHGSPNYGYEQWMTVADDVKGSGDIEVKDIPGGVYAVAKCTLSNIGDAWLSLVASVEESNYEMRDGHCLEECLSSVPAGFPDSTFDLYLPIASAEK